MKLLHSAAVSNPLHWLKLARNATQEDGEMTIRSLRQSPSVTQSMHRLLAAAKYYKMWITTCAKKPGFRFGKTPGWKHKFGDHCQSEIFAILCKKPVNVFCRITCPCEHDIQYVRTRGNVFVNVFLVFACVRERVEKMSWLLSSNFMLGTGATSVSCVRGWGYFGASSNDFFGGSEMPCPGRTWFHLCLLETFFRYPGTVENNCHPNYYHLEKTASRMIGYRQDRYQSTNARYKCKANMNSTFEFWVIKNFSN